LESKTKHYYIDSSINTRGFGSQKIARIAFYMKVTMSAPGKIALFGEHAVVWGQPAIVSAIDRRVHVTVEGRTDSMIKISAMDLHVPGVVLTFQEGNKAPVIETDYGRIVNAVAYVRKAIDVCRKHLSLSADKGANVTIHSEMPVGAGLGTSAAVSVATLAAYTRLMGHELRPEELARLGHITELEVQGAASPMDTAITTHGGILYIRPTKPDPYIETVGVPVALPAIIGYTERESSTAEMLRRVKDLRNSNPRVIDSIMSSIGEVVESAKAALISGDLFTVGKLMNINHGLLESLGVSSKRLNDMVYSTRFAGAIGSKITGAGGGGCIIALCPGKEAEVSTAIRIAGGMPIQSRLSKTGLKLESLEQ